MLFARLNPNNAQVVCCYCAGLSHAPAHRLQLHTGLLDVIMHKDAEGGLEGHHEWVIFTILGRTVLRIAA